jgi:hypothetical protein
MKFDSVVIEIGRYCERLLGNSPLHPHITADVCVPLDWELRSKDNTILCRVVMFLLEHNAVDTRTWRKIIR